MKRVLAFAYSLTCYAVFFGTFLYAVGFIGGVGVPTKLDGPLEGSIFFALAVNLSLLAIFALQHSLMARPRFKKRWARIVPQQVERSTYVLCSSLAMILMFVFWQPMGATLWQVEHTTGRIVLFALFGLGWLTLLGSTFLINHFDLFGLRQAYFYVRGENYRPLAFQTPGLYRYVRHPLYIGWLMTFWFTPTMTAAHMLFAIGCTAYILFAIRFEERDLAAELGPAYQAYRQRTPMFVPRLLTSK